VSAAFAIFYFIFLICFLFFFAAPLGLLRATTLPRGVANFYFATISSIFLSHCSFSALRIFYSGDLIKRSFAFF
jgi:hypothetical protein